MPSVLEAIRAARRRASAPPADGRKALEHGPPLRAPGKYGRPIRSTWSIDQAIDRQLKASVLVYRGVMGHASALGSVRWVAEVLDGGKWRPDPSHELQGFIDQPHRFFPRQDFNEVLAMFLVLAGNALFQRTMASGKPMAGASRPRLLELTPLIPEGIEPIPDPEEWLAGYRFNRGGVRKDWKAEEILHFMIRDPSNLYWGLSPLKSATGVVKMDIAAVRWNAESFENRAISDGVFSTEQQLTDAQYEELADQVYEQHVGGTRGAPWILQRGMTWQDRDRSPVEMDFNVSRKMVREDVLSSIGMPPVVAGYFEQATLANADASRRLFWEDNHIPTFVERTAGGLNMGVVPHFGDPAKLRIAYDISGIPALREDMQKKAAILRLLVSTGTPYNQAIAELQLDLPPIEGAGDLPFGLEQFKPAPSLFGGGLPPGDDPAREEGTRSPSQEEEREESGKRLRPRARKAGPGVAVSSSIFTTEIADAAERGFRVAWLQLVAGLSGEAAIGKLREALERNAADVVAEALGGNRLDTEIAKRIGERIAATVRQAAARSAQLFGAEVGSVITPDPSRISRWLVPYQLERTAQLGGATRRAIAETVADFTSGRLGKDLDAVAELVRGLWGLHSQQAAGVRNLYAALVEQGKATGAAVEQALKLARARLAERAAVIAAHEAFTAANRGNAMVWEQALDEGKVSSLFALWVTADDSDVDEDCLALEGREINYAAGERFPAEPPIHPGCRCGIVWSATPGL